MYCDLVSVWTSRTKWDDQVWELCFKLKCYFFSLKPFFSFLLCLQFLLGDLVKVNRQELTSSGADFVWSHWGIYPSAPLCVFTVVSERLVRKTYFQDVCSHCWKEMQEQSLVAELGAPRAPDLPHVGWECRQSGKSTWPVTQSTCFFFGKIEIT